MKKVITSEVIVAYSQCPLKAFRLLFDKGEKKPHEYAEIIEQRKCATERKYINAFREKNSDVQPYNTHNLRKRSDFLINATLQAEGLEADCSILTKMQGSSSLGRYSYEPTIFVGTHSISNEQKIELAFVGHVLSQVQGKTPVAGKIIGVDQKSHRVKLEDSSKTLVPLLEPLREWMRASSPEPPPVILNKHCSYCQFQHGCREKAEQEDNLSLLDRMTPKLMQRYQKKGIFTVKQLSYLFKPRRGRKGKERRAHFKPELQALAIRTGKIYIQELPELYRHQVELFLDIEGIPDQQVYYLIGLLVCEEDVCTYHSFWADTTQDEAQIWRQFLEKVNQYPDAPIYHYGSYEPKAIDKLARRYETDNENIKNRLVNINSYIYGKVYFPVRSNSLKEIGKFIGASWTSPDASGLQSLVWRDRWEETQNGDYKQMLITYNEEDYRALQLLTDELSRIKRSADTLQEVDFANQPKKQATEVGEQIHSQFGEILKFAHSRYDKSKISFQGIGQKKSEEDSEKKKNGTKKGYQGQRRIRPRPTKVVEVEQGKFCPKHKEERVRPAGTIAKRTIIDFVLTISGIRKTITEYIGIQGYCAKCARVYSPPDIRKYGPNQLYGHGLKSWFVYQRVALRLPYEKAAEMMLEQFNEQVSWGYTAAFVKDLSQYYVETEQIIIKNLLESPFIHADETPISIRGVTQYVWVFTDGKYVVFKLNKTREATIVHEFLANYNGTLVSDFYAGYDSLKCKQQKCWVHLIRDLNNGLWEVKWTPLSRPILGEFKVDCVFVFDRHLLCEVEVSGYVIVESLVRAFLVIEEEVVGQSLDQERDGVIGPEIEVFVFDGAPEAFDEHVVQGSTSAVHTDLDAFYFQPLCVSQAGELGTLVGIEDVGAAQLERIVQGVYAEIRVQRVAHPPGEHIPAIPVHHRHQVHEALWHRHIGNVGAPDLVGASDGHASQQVGIDATRRMGPAGVGTRIDGFQPHFAHQPLHALTVDLVSQDAQPGRHPSRPIEGPFCVLPVDQTHQEQVLRGLACRLVVETGAGKAKQLALSAQADIRMGRIDQPALGLN